MQGNDEIAAKIAAAYGSDATGAQEALQAYQQGAGAPRRDLLQPPVDPLRIAIERHDEEAVEYLAEAAKYGWDY